MRRLRPIGRRVGRKIYQIGLEARAKRQVTNLNHRNASSHDSVLGGGDAVVSLTTHGARAQSVHLAIESIALGKVLPRRFVLWLDDAALMANLPAPIRRLEQRGLEVRLTENFGPHTKYYPYVRDEIHPYSSLVTADDDVIVPRYWLQNLLRARSRNPAAICCYRAHRFGFEPTRVAGYNSWMECWSSEPSIVNFNTGVSGSAYPRQMVDALRARGDAFVSVSPRADDVWLHNVAVENEILTKQVYSVPLEFPLVPSSQSEGLFHSNVDGGENDKQISATYSSPTLARLKAALDQDGSSRRVK